MGVGHFELQVTGRSAHSGLAPESGVSAIRELADLIMEVYELADPPERSANVGVIGGGTRHNVIAGHGQALIEMRALRTEDARQMEDQLRALRSRHHRASIHVSGGWTDHRCSTRRATGRSGSPPRTRREGLIFALPKRPSAAPPMETSRVNCDLRSRPGRGRRRRPRRRRACACRLHGRPCGCLPCCSSSLDF